MAYNSELETRIAKKVTRAITEHNLIEDGDRIMVGLSGGKDSWALIQILDTSDTPCSLCARLRRGALYRLADTVGATKIALGHHADDFIETLLLNVFFQGSIKAMPARLVSDNGRHVVIRPLAYVLESEARAYAREANLPIIGCCCPACGDLSLQRQRMKRLIAQLEVEHPEIKNSILRALGNVQTRHLLVRPAPPGSGLETGQPPGSGLKSSQPVVPGLEFPLQLVKK